MEANGGCSVCRYEKTCEKCRPIEHQEVRSGAVQAYAASRVDPMSPEENLVPVSHDVGGPVRRDGRRKSRVSSKACTAQRRASLAVNPRSESATQPDAHPSLTERQRHALVRSATTPTVQSLSHHPGTEVSRNLLELHDGTPTFFTRAYFELILPRLDGSRALICATQAVVSKLQSRLRPGFDSSALPSGLTEYTNALTEIRSSFGASEDILLAINMLCYYDLMAGFNVKLIAYHARGLHSLLLANPERWATNKVGRTVLFGTRLPAVEGCIAAGLPSPFEQDIWLQNGSLSPHCSDAAILSKRTHQIFFKLPSLVRYLSKIRAGDTSFMTMCETAGLAQRILRIKDEDAYRSILQSCEERETTSELDRPLTPTSLHFADLEEFDDFLDYCRARLTIITICLALPRFLPRYAVPQLEELQQQQLEAFERILQCWECCMESRRFAKSMCTAFFPLYGTLRRIESYRGKPAAKVIAWLELRSVTAFGHIDNFQGERDLASTWDMYCGGPPQKSIYKDWAP